MNTLSQYIIQTKWCTDWPSSSLTSISMQAHYNTTAPVQSIVSSSFTVIMPLPLGGGIRRRWCVSDVCLSDNVWRLSCTSIDSSGPARPAWLKAAAACFHCRGRRHILASSHTACYDLRAITNWQSSVTKSTLFWCRTASVYCCQIWNHLVLDIKIEQRSPISGYEVRCMYQTRQTVQLLCPHPRVGGGSSNDAHLTSVCHIHLS